VSSAKALLEGLVQESVTYRLPASKNVLFYDFYALAYLQSLQLDPEAKGSDSFKGASQTSFTTRDSVSRDVEHAAGVLIPYLRKELSNATFLSICAEIRHLFDNHQSPEFWQTMTNHRLFRLYARKQAEAVSSISNLPGVNRPVRTPPVSGTQPGYDKAMKAAIWAIKKGGSTMGEFVRLARYAFQRGHWSSSYGGKAWANICDGWEMLNSDKSNDLKSAAVAIDHVFDMQHNTGTVLNKVQEYAINGGYGWLSGALNYKASVKSIHALLDRCSSDMRKLSKVALKSAGIPDEHEPPPKTLKLAGYNAQPPDPPLHGKVGVVDSAGNFQTTAINLTGRFKFPEGAIGNIDAPACTVISGPITFPEKCKRLYFPNLVAASFDIVFPHECETISMPRIQHPHFKNLPFKCQDLNFLGALSLPSGFAFPKVCGDVYLKSLKHFPMNVVWPEKCGSFHLDSMKSEELLKFENLPQAHFLCQDKMVNGIAQVAPKGDEPKTEKTPHWVKEFGPEYAVPIELYNNSDFVDGSWHNDACPSFYYHLSEDLIIYCEHPDPDKREDTCSARFTACSTNEFSGFVTFYEGDDVRRAMEAIKKAYKEGPPKQQEPPSQEPPAGPNLNIKI